MIDDLHSFEAKAFLGLLAVATFLFSWLLFPFFDVLFWAIVIGVLFAPLYSKLRAHTGLGANTAAVLSVLLALVAIILPLAWLFYSCLQEATDLYAQLSANTKELHTFVDRLRDTFPEAQAWLASYGYDAENLKAKLSNLAISLGGMLAKNTMALGGGAAQFLTNLVLVLYISFFLLRDGWRLRALLIKALPFGDHREERLFSKFAGVMRATVKGSLLVAMAQGALGGLIFAILDIRAAVLWGVVMAVLSLIPVVGAALVWLPTAIYLAITGSYMEAGILVAFGACVIGLADNILRPILVGRDTKLPDFMVLLSTLGGFSLFGMDGFVTGPMLAVLFVTVWQIFIEERDMGTLMALTPAHVQNIAVPSSSSAPTAMPSEAASQDSIYTPPQETAASAAQTTTQASCPQNADNNTQSQ